MRKPAACFLFSVFALTLATSVARADESAVPLGPPTAAEQEQVRVHITTTKDVTERTEVFALGEHAQFSHICTAPCDALLPPATRLAIRMNKSEEDARGTVRTAYGPDVDVAIGPPRRTSTKIGAALLVTGLLLVGGAVGAYASFASRDDDRRGSSDSPVLISGKAVGMIIGIPLGIAGFTIGGAGAAFLATASDAPSVDISRHREKTSASR